MSNEQALQAAAWMVGGAIGALLALLAVVLIGFGIWKVGRRLFELATRPPKPKHTVVIGMPSNTAYTTIQNEQIDYRTMTRRLERRVAILVDQRTAMAEKISELEAKLGDLEDKYYKALNLSERPVAIARHEIDLFLDEPKDMNNANT